MSDTPAQQRPSPTLQAFLFTGIACLLVGMVVVHAGFRAAPAWDDEAVPTLRIDVNTADAATLQLLSGIGPVLADRIVDEREARPFTDADDLQRVTGIGPVTSQRLEPHLVFDDASVSDPP